MHYLDNSATTKVLKSSADASMETMITSFANPSSLHSFGYQSSKNLLQARETIAKTMNVSTNEIIFTSGGTESINTAILGAAHHMKRYGKHIITTEIEHSATLNTVKKLEGQGYRVSYIRPDINGNISIKDIQNELRQDTILISCMMVNNETGAILPVEEIGNLLKCQNHNALFHIDAVQAYGKMRVFPKTLGCHLLSISGHKIGAPKGVGCLYIHKNLNINSLITGGGQEFNIRGGTEAMPNIMALSVAASYRCDNIDVNYSHICELKEYLQEQLKCNFKDIFINSPDGLSFITNFSLMGCKSEVMLRILGEFGVYVSSGSACSKGKPSHVLKAMGLSKDRIDSALRVSFCPESNKDDIDALIIGLKHCIKTLRR